MGVLIPVGGADVSKCAFDFAIEMIDGMSGSPHIAHYTNSRTDATEAIPDSACDRLKAGGFSDESELSTITVDIWTADRVGEETPDTVERDGFDRVVMSYHKDDVTK